MKKQSYILKIDKPCGENWDTMTDTENGKFCSSCSKSVIDFTQLTDNEVLQIIEQNSGKLCGRLTKEQLNRAIQLYQPTNNSRFYKLLIGLLLVGASENSLATDNQKLQQDIISIVDYNDNNLQQTVLQTEPADSIGNVVQGLVIDAKTKEPLPFAEVKIKDTNTGVVTDVDGKFKLVVPDNLITDKIHLVIKYVGYKQTEIVINKNDLPITKELGLVPNENVLMGSIIIEKEKK